MRVITQEEYRQIVEGVTQKAQHDAMSARWRGYPDDNQSEISAYEVIRSIFPQLNVIPTSDQLRRLGEVYMTSYANTMRNASVSPAAGGKRTRRKTKRTRLQRKI